MKKIAFILLFPALCFGQNVVTKDTVWQSNANGNFYENRLVEYSNGESSLNRRLVGDTATVFSGYLTSFEKEGSRMANVAYEARDFDKIIRGMIQRRDTVLAQIGRDLTDTLAAKYAGALIVPGWEVTEDTTTLDITFSVSNAGQLRYEITGQPTRNAFIFGRSIRLNNYKDTGKSLDLYNAPGGNWFSVDDKVKIKFPGNPGLSKSAAAAPPPENWVLLEYFTDPSGKVQVFAGERVTLKKSGAKYIVKAGGKTFELIEKK